MMHKLKNSNLFYALASALPFFVALWFIFYEMIMVLTGTSVSLIVTGYDPADILRGQYIRYDFLLSNIQEGDPENNNIEYFYDEGYLELLDSNNDGIYDSFGCFYWEDIPDVYIKASGCSSSNGTLFVSIPQAQCRYYLDERIVGIVEEKINNTGSFQINGTINNGLFRASSIEVNSIKY